MQKHTGPSHPPAAAGVAAEAVAGAPSWECLPDPSCEAPVAAVRSLAAECACFFSRIRRSPGSRPGQARPGGEGQGANQGGEDGGEIGTTPRTAQPSPPHLHQACLQHSPGLHPNQYHTHPTCTAPPLTHTWHARSTHVAGAAPHPPPPPHTHRTWHARSIHVAGAAPPPTHTVPGMPAVSIWHVRATVSRKSAGSRLTTRLSWVRKVSTLVERLGSIRAMLYGW